MKSIYLVGFMGVGKTTVGQLLGKAYGLPVYDVDSIIEKKQGCTIKEIFACKGEDYFRQIECSALKQLPSRNGVITTGGGIVGEKGNLAFMKEHGIVIHLDATFDTIVSRIGNDISRPLFQQRLEDVKALYKRRAPLYQQAHYTIQTDRKTIVEIVEEIKGCIGRM